MRIYIIVPAFNESRYIGRFLERLHQVTRSVIVVDDGSSDKTSEIVREYGAICLTHLSNLGKGSALKTGCDYAFKKMKADAVIVMDGDDQHEPSDSKLFMEELRRGADIVHGVRQMDAKMPVGRKIANYTMSLLIQLVFGRYIADIPSGFKAFTKQAYKAVKWDSSGYEVETEIAVRIAKSHLSYIEIPISTIYHEKDYGFNLIDAWRILIKIPYWVWR